MLGMRKREVKRILILFTDSLHPGTISASVFSTQASETLSSGALQAEEYLGVQNAFFGFRAGNANIRAVATRFRLPGQDKPTGNDNSFSALCRGDKFDRRA